MPPFKPVKTEKFAQEVANQIKLSIFDGTYASGDKVSWPNFFA
jgi:DNA-binding FadR family transcriptional regulator